MLPATNLPPCAASRARRQDSSSRSRANIDRSAAAMRETDRGDMPAVDIGPRRQQCRGGQHIERSFAVTAFVPHTSL